MNSDLFVTWSLYLKSFAYRIKVRKSESKRSTDFLKVLFFFPHFPQVCVLSPALTVTRSSVHQVIGKPTLRLTSKACSRRSTSFPAEATKPKCPKVTYLCPISPCRNPSSSLTLVRALVDSHVCFSFLLFTYPVWHKMSLLSSNTCAA